MNPSTILFDTHAWLWLMAGEGKIAPKVLSLIEQLKENNSLYLADISLWEISMLSLKDRITLGQPTLTWIKQALRISNLQLVHLTPEIAIESTELPGSFHGDSADRIIVATARLLNLTIATRDSKILEYGKLKRVHTLPI